MTTEELTDMLNEIQEVVDRYDYDVGGYNTCYEDDDDMFEILLIKK